MPRLVFSIMLRLVSPILGLHSFTHIYLIAPPSFNTALILEDPINRGLKTHKLVSSASLPVVESHHFVWLALNSQNRIPIGISK